jgi:hypothetical protein
VAPRRRHRPANGDTVTSELHDAFAIRYRVL